jgi:phosphatidylglycerophosphatase A
MRFVVIFLASAAYVGYIPVASGTFGSVVAIPLFWGFDHLRALSVPLYLGLLVAAIGASCWIAGRAEEYLAEHDSHKIVLDEIVGFLTATLFLPTSWTCTLAAFFVFRAFDVLKPFPANYVDAKFPGGYGVVLDDVVSGLYTNLVLRVLLAVGVIA